MRTERLAALLGDTLGDGDGADAARLRDDDVALRAASSLDERVEHVLGYLQRRE